MAVTTNDEAIKKFKSLNDALTEFLYEKNLTYAQREAALAAYRSASVEIEDSLAAAKFTPFEIPSNSAKEVNAALDALKAEIAKIAQVTKVITNVLSTATDIAALLAKFMV